MSHFKITEITENEITVHSHLWNWSFTFDRFDGHMTGGIELASRLTDDGAELAEWAIAYASAYGIFSHS